MSSGSKSADSAIRYTEEAKALLLPQCGADVRERGSLDSQWSTLYARLESRRGQGGQGGNRTVAQEYELRLEAAATRAGELTQATEPASLEGDDAAILLASISAISAHGSGMPEMAVSYLIDRVGLLPALEGVISAHVYPPADHHGHARHAKPIIQHALFNGYLVADEATQRAYAKRVEAAYEGADLALRISLVFCMRSRSEWANECTAAFLEQTDIRSIEGPLFELISDVELAFELLDREIRLNPSGINIVANLGIRALEVIEELLENHPRERWVCGTALSCIRTPGAADLFVAHLRKKDIRPFATEFFSQNPELANDALSGLAKKKTKLADVAREILEGLERAVVSTSTPSGDNDDVPLVLREPPWHSKARAKRKRIHVEDLRVPKEPMELRWPERSRQRWIAEHFTKGGVRASADEVAKYRARIADGHNVGFRAAMPLELLLELLREPPKNFIIYSQTPLELLGFFGEAALEQVLSLYEEKRAKLMGHFALHIESPALIPLLVAAKKSEEIHTTLQWCKKYPAAAIAGLVPAAVRKRGRERAEVWLRYLSRCGQAEAIRAVAKSHGEKCAKSIDEVLSADAREDCPKSAPQMPTFFRPSELRAPKLKSGESLSLHAVECLGEMLAFAYESVPYVGLEEVRDACDPQSLADFAWDLAQAWETNRADGQHDWMVYAVLHFGDDATVRRLTPALRGKAIGLMLSHIGSDAACMELQSILLRAPAKRSGPTKEAAAAQEGLRFIAACRGVPVEELKDGFAPTAYLDEERGIELDLGTMKVRAHFDEQLQPHLLGEKGKVLKRLPSGAKVDAAKLKLAKAKWKEIGGDMSALVSSRGHALEAAMVEERAWSLEKFRELWLEHPLLRLFARAIVWEALDAEGKALETFRVTRDGSFANSADEEWSPKDMAHVRVAHPGYWTSATQERWLTLFSDYELASPLAQLKRPSEAENSRDRDGDRESIYQPCSEDTSEVLQELVKAGWCVVDSHVLIRPLGDDSFLFLHLDGESAKVRSFRNGRAFSLAELSPCARSEARYILQRLGEC